MNSLKTYYKVTFTVLFIFCITLGGVLLYIEQLRLNEQPVYSYSIEQVGDTFYYEIHGNGKVLIKQKNIPAVRGLQYFQNFSDAQKVARLVISKIEADENPMVTKKELESMNIIFFE